MRLLTMERSDKAAVVTLNRPERRNAFSLDLMQALIETLGIIGNDSDVRAVILASEGDVFSAGHDLNELIGRGEEEYRATFETCTQMMLRLQEIPQPVIAEVQGLATAGGCQLVAACDLAVAAATAAFATPGVKIGLFCTLPMVPIVRSIGRKRAMEMLLLGDAIPAEQAREWGLINRVVPREQLRATTLDLAARIAEASPRTIASGKRSFYEQIALNERDAYAAGCETMRQDVRTPDAVEGIAAFLGKRQPSWK